ncbi:hypothetical protein BDZ85DRAFT_6740 [Elsinoe ampelina]|uniref:Uncharacterized protein n=1 Tax=Elsinoe ampelina TaxID=302913 RepID=A0A6A6GQ83_9PEZI|nr:hypothetical protein BDZ85DRAFT_6740 [Elsinoe ampelina]
MRAFTTYGIHLSLAINLASCHVLPKRNVGGSWFNPLGEIDIAPANNPDNQGQGGANNPAQDFVPIRRGANNQDPPEKRGSSWDNLAGPEEAIADVDLDGLASLYQLLRGDTPSTPEGFVPIKRRNADSSGGGEMDPHAHKTTELSRASMVEYRQGSSGGVSVEMERANRRIRREAGATEDRDRANQTPAFDSVSGQMDYPHSQPYRRDAEKTVPPDPSRNSCLTCARDAYPASRD